MPQKVVLLPQGQFAQFLKSKPKNAKNCPKDVPRQTLNSFAALTEEAKTAQRKSWDENTQRGYLERARVEMRSALQALLDVADPTLKMLQGRAPLPKTLWGGRLEQLTAESVTAENVEAAHEKRTKTPTTFLSR